ncbi:hypothetical protein [Streptomyces sp. NPDC086182]|jgi:hypothetical protein|uniref:hypothetical protein n=1 Tax=Streptomyces sp. NPDC086182 TaxID=3155058 RepID=UPI003426E0F0
MPDGGNWILLGCPPGNSICRPVGTTLISAVDDCHRQLRAGMVLRTHGAVVEKVAADGQADRSFKSASQQQYQQVDTLRF